MRMRFQNYLGNWGVTDRDQDGRCVVTWLNEDGSESDVQCYGWIAGADNNDPILFLPANGDGLDEFVFDDDGNPSSYGNWYVADSGHRALVGLPGSPLATLF